MFGKNSKELFPNKSGLKNKDLSIKMEGRLSQVVGKLLGGGPVCESQCNDVRCCTSTQRVVDPRWPHPERPRQVSEGSETSVATFWRRRKQRHMTTIYCDSRKRVAGDDASFEMDIGETIHPEAGDALVLIPFL